VILIFILQYDMIRRRCDCQGEKLKLEALNLPLIFTPRVERRHQYSGGGIGGAPSTTWTPRHNRYQAKPSTDRLTSTYLLEIIKPRRWIIIAMIIKVPITTKPL